MQSGPPTLELRIPISPADSDLLMVRYLLESIQVYGGPIAKSARCVLSIGADEEPWNLFARYRWLEQFDVAIRWTDRKLFQTWEYDGTGLDRFLVESDADVVAMLDADLLVAGDFDEHVLRSHSAQEMLGFMAHISPFGYGQFRDTPSEVWWKRIFEAAEMECPSLDWQLSAWGLDPGFNPNIALADPQHRWAPPYFNYGVILGPRRFFDAMATDYLGDLEIVAKAAPGNRYTSQIANCLGFERLNISCGELPLNLNFPLNLPADEMRKLNPDPSGHSTASDIRIFHYIGGRKLFLSDEALDQFMAEPQTDETWTCFQSRLKELRSRISDNCGVRTR